MANQRGRTIAAGLLIAILAFPAGYIILTVMEQAIHWLWFGAAENLGTPALWVFTLALPTIAGLLVAWMRSAGSNGHNPLGGISFSPVHGHEYPTVIGGIFISLVGGLILGPEAAIVCTGAVIGTVIGSRTGLPIKLSVGIGSSAAILALFVNPIRHGTFSVSTTYEFRWNDLVGALVVGLLTAVVLMIGRILALQILKISGGDKPNLLLISSSGLAVGLLAMIYFTVTGHDISLVMTSGENTVKNLLALGSVGAILFTVALKWLGYSLAMGGGFRGGPFFPAIFIGGGIGGAIGLIAPDLAQGAVVGGFTAAVVYLAHPKWGAVLVIAIALGLIGGGPALIPISIVAGIVAKLIPAVKLQEKAEQKQEPTPASPNPTT